MGLTFSNETGISKIYELNVKKRSLKNKSASRCLFQNTLGQKFHVNREHCVMGLNKGRLGIFKIPL